MTVRRALHLAWLTSVRQPARSLLGILGVAAIGALLFDMLLLSRGLVLSFGDLLERSGFDVRVVASDAPPFTGPRLTGATTVAADIAAVPGIAAVLQLRVREAEVVPDRPSPSGTAGDRANEVRVHFIGADPRVRSMWRVTEGQDLPDSAASGGVAVVNRQIAQAAGPARWLSAFAARPL